LGTEETITTRHRHYQLSVVTSQVDFILVLAHMSSSMNRRTAVEKEEEKKCLSFFSLFALSIRKRMSMHLRAVTNPTNVIGM